MAKHDVHKRSSHTFADGILLYFFRQKTRRPHLKCYFIGHSKISKQTDRDKIYVENFETAKMEWMNYFIANL